MVSEQKFITSSGDVMYQAAVLPAAIGLLRRIVEPSSQASRSMATDRGIPFVPTPAGSIRLGDDFVEPTRLQSLVHAANSEVFEAFPGEKPARLTQPRPVVDPVQMLPGQRQTNLFARLQAFQSVPGRPVGINEPYVSEFAVVDFEAFERTYELVLALGGLGTWAESDVATTDIKRGVRTQTIKRAVRQLVPFAAAPDEAKKIPERTVEAEAKLILGLPRSVYVQAQSLLAEQAATLVAQQATAEIETKSANDDFSSVAASA